MNEIKSIKNLSGKITNYEILKKNLINNPKISVIIPIYNVENHIEECIESLINQTLKDIEIIFVNDETQDSSFEIAKRYAENDNRIALITQKNYGAGVARNAGLAMAKGEYLLFMDSDDMLENFALEKLYNEAKSNLLDILIFNCFYYDNQTKNKKVVEWSVKKYFIPDEKIFSYKEYSKYIYNCSPNWAWNKLFNRDFINSHNLIFQDSAHTNDTYFTCIALALANRMSILNEPLLLYRVNQKNTLTSTGIRNKKPLEILNVLSAIQDKLMELDRYDIVKQSFFNLILEQLRFNLDKTSGLARCLLKLNIRYIYLKKFNMEKLQDSEIYFSNLILLLNELKTYNILHEIFSVKDQIRGDIKHKVVTILGVKIKIK